MATNLNGRSVITGVVVPSRWRKDGTVSGVSIQSYDQKEYVVKLNERGKMLLDALHKVIRVTGKVSPTIDGRRILKITRFEIDSREGGNS